MRAIFRSTGQAISFSYLMQAFEASPESALAKQMRYALAEAGECRRSTVDFGMLNPLEIRGQCAMIRAAIENRLPKHEADAMKARYGIVLNNKQPDGTIHTDITEERRRAIIDLAGYLHPQFNSVPRLALAWLVTRAVGNVPSMRPPFRTIETLCGGSKSEFGRVNPRLLTRLAQIEASAIDRLTPDFERDGLVCCESIAA